MKRSEVKPGMFVTVHGETVLVRYLGLTAAQGSPFAPQDAWSACDEKGDTFYATPRMMRPVSGTKLSG